MSVKMGFPGSTVVRNLPFNAEDTRDSGSMSRSGRSPGERNGSYSCLEYSMDRETLWDTVHVVTKRWTQLNVQMYGCTR